MKIPRKILKPYHQILVCITYSVHVYAGNLEQKLLNTKVLTKLRWDFKNKNLSVSGLNFQDWTFTCTPFPEETFWDEPFLNGICQIEPFSTTIPNLPIKLWRLIDLYSSSQTLLRFAKSVFILSFSGSEKCIAASPWLNLICSNWFCWCELVSELRFPMFASAFELVCPENVGDSEKCTVRKDGRRQETDK